MDLKTFQSGHWADSSLLIEAQKLGVPLSEESLAAVRENLALLKERSATLDEAVPEF